MLAFAHVLLGSCLPRRLLYVVVGAAGSEKARGIVGKRWVVDLVTVQRGGVGGCELDPR